MYVLCLYKKESNKKITKQLWRPVIFFRSNSNGYMHVIFYRPNNNCHPLVATGEVFNEYTSFSSGQIIMATPDCLLVK